MGATMPASELEVLRAYYEEMHPKHVQTVARLALAEKKRDAWEETAHWWYDEWAALDEQISRLANYIMEHVTGEPSQSEGAVDTAIRLLREKYG